MKASLHLSLLSLACLSVRGKSAKFRVKTLTVKSLATIVSTLDNIKHPSHGPSTIPYRKMRTNDICCFEIF